MNNYAYLGIAKAGRIKILHAEDGQTGRVRVTSLALQSAQAPETAEVDLVNCDGFALLVRGIRNGDWIYSARIVEQAGQIVGLLVQKAFGEPLDYPQG